MKLSRILKITGMLLLLSSSGFSQDTNDDSSDDSQPKPTDKKGFKMGLIVGSYFANKYTSSLYDGYGFDVDGNRNNFTNSFMNQKINMQYGGYGYAGQPDQIAQALNVDYHTWTFDESDMPVNMRYRPAFLVGLNMKYSTGKRGAIILNVNAVKLTIDGNFTIITPLPAASSNVNDRVKTFGIKGGEQRLILQFGYQYILGGNDKINCFVEGGLDVTFAKFDDNEILINNLNINLTDYYNTTLYTTQGPVKRPIGVGYGAFGGFGANITMSPKWIVQLLYSPLYEGINIGVDPKLKLQNAVGLRAYYML